MVYTKGRKIVVSGGAVNAPDRIHAWRNVSMTTLPPHAPKGKPYTIYALIDPRDNAVRYIGLTYDVYARMRQHSRCEGNNAIKNAWIQELRREQIMFYMHSIEKVKTFEQALEREQYWIQHYLQRGANLTNIASVPVDSTEPKKIRLYKREQFEKLFFRAYTGCIVSFYGATEEEFDEFIKRYLEIDENLKYPGWPDFQRRRAINYAMKNEIALNFCEAAQEGA